MYLKRVLSAYDAGILKYMPGIMLVSTLAAIDQTALSNALRDISRDFSSADATPWTVTVYLMALSIFAPILGRLGDIHGRKFVLQLAVGTFTIASLACGASGSIYELIIFRGLQGIGGAGLLSVPNAILADHVAPRERGKYQVFISIVWLLAALGGAGLGGLLIAIGGWRLIFWINLPLGLVAMTLIQFTIPRQVKQKAIELDIAGSLLLSGVIGGALYAIHELGSLPIHWEPVWLCIGVVFVCGVAFVAVEKRAKSALIPPALALNREFLMINVASLIIVTCQFGFNAYLPTFLQSRFAMSALDAGIWAGPVLVAVPMGVMFSSWMMHRTGRYRPLAIAGTAMLALSLLAFYLFGDKLAFWQLLLLGAAVSGSTGLVGVPLMIGLQSQVDRSELGVATAAVVVCRNFGSAAGTSLMGAVMFTQFSPEAMSQAFVSATVILAALAALAFFTTLKLEDKELAGNSQPAQART